MVLECLPFQIFLKNIYNLVDYIFNTIINFLIFKVDVLNLITLLNIVYIKFHAQHIQTSLIFYYKLVLSIYECSLVYNKEFIEIRHKYAYSDCLKIL